MNFMTAMVEIKCDDRDLRRKLPGVKTRVNQTVSYMQKRFDSINFRRAALSVVGFTTTLVGLSYKVTKVAADAVETQNKFEQVFKYLTPEVSGWADEFARSAGRSRKEIRDFLSLLQDTFVPLGFTRSKSAELSKTLTELSLDVASLNNKMDSEVLANFQSAVVGNVRAVRKYGILLSQAAIQQELYNMGINKSIAHATAQEKVQARVNLLIKGSRDAMGDVIRTAFTFINQGKRLRGNLLNLAQSIGEYLLPNFTEAIVKLNEWLELNEKMIAQKVGEWLKDVAESTKNVALWMKENADTLILAAKAFAGLWVIGKLIKLFAALKVAVVALKANFAKFIVVAKGVATSVTAAVAAAAAGLLLIRHGMKKNKKAHLEFLASFNKFMVAANKFEMGMDKSVKAINKFSHAAKYADEKTQQFMSQFSEEEMMGVWSYQALKGTKFLQEYYDELERNRDRYSRGAKGELEELKRQVQEKARVWQDLQNQISMSSRDIYNTTRKQAQDAHADFEQAFKKYHDAQIDYDNKVRDHKIKLFEETRGYEQEAFDMKLQALKAEHDAIVYYTGEEAAATEWLKQKKQELRLESSRVAQAFMQAADSVEYSMSDAIQGIMEQQVSLREGFDSVMRSIVQSVDRAVAQMIAAWLRWKIMSTVGSAIGGSTGAFFSQMAGSNPFAAPTGHFGGVAGHLGNRKSVSPWVFCGAQKLHNGGRAGLAPDEVPTILRKGEKVSTGEDQPVNVNVNIQAIDTQTGLQFLMRNEHALATLMQKAVRDNHPFRRGS